MDISSIVPSLVSAAALIAVAIIETRNGRRQAEVDRRAKIRMEESRLSMAMMDATIGLAMDTAQALKEGHTNGTLEGNMTRARNARAAYRSFLEQTAAEQIGGEK